MKLATHDQVESAMSLLLSEYNTNIEPLKGVTFNQPLNIAWIGLTQNNQFQEAGDEDDIYYNIVTKGVNTANKKINIRRKNLILENFKVK